MISVLKTLDSFLSLHSDEIVSRENSEVCAMHLYDMGGWWVAFDRSAYPSVLRMKDGSGIPMVMEGIPSAALSCLCRGIKVLHREKGYRVVSASSYDPHLYVRWKDECLSSC